MTRPMDTRLQQQADSLQRQAAEASAHVWVSANAGTGKTEVLTRRILTLLLTDLDLSPRHILALTFTNMGAREMAERLPAQVMPWATMGDDELTDTLATLLGQTPTPAQLARARQLPTLLPAEPPLITTIHGFGQTVLQRFPHEAGLEAGFDVLEGAAQHRLLREAMHHAVVQAKDEDALALDLLLEDFGDRALEDLSSLTVNAWPRLTQLFTDTGGIEGAVNNLAALLDIADPVAYPTLAAHMPLLQAWLTALEEAPSSHNHKAAVRLRSLIGQETAASWLELFMTDEGTPRKQQMGTKPVVEALGAAYADLLNLQQDVAAALESQRATTVYTRTLAWLRWGWWVRQCYEDLKQQRAQLDFTDMITRLSQLLAGTDGRWIHYRLDRRIRHLLLDEGQDNSPAQHAIFNLLTRELLSGEASEGPRTVFAVGDVKQSIYRFQGAAPALFRSLRETLAATSGTFRELTFVQSFRSVPAVLQAVDDVLGEPARAAIVTGDANEPWPRHVSVYTGQPGSVELWPLVLTEKEKEETPAGWAPFGPHTADSRGVAEVATRIAVKMKELAQGPALPSTGRPFCWGDALVLAQTNKTAAQLAANLIRQGVPVQLTGKNENLPSVVEDMMSWLRVMTNPHDRLALASLLKSPLAGWNDGQLQKLFQTEGNVWQEVAEIDVATAKWLQRGREITATRTPHAALLWLIESRNAVSRYVGDDTTRRHDLLTALDDLLASALGVVESTALIAKWEQEPPSLSPAAGEDRVRVMTVHKAKGLGAPVVFVADTMRSYKTRNNKSNEDKLLWEMQGDQLRNVCMWPSEKELPHSLKGLLEEEMKRRRADSLRSLYVAMTRARDHLYIAGWSKQNDATAADTDNIPLSWYGMVATAAEAHGWQRDESGTWYRHGGEMEVTWQKDNDATPPTPAPAWLYDETCLAAEEAPFSSAALHRGEVVHALLDAAGRVPTGKRQPLLLALLERLAPAWPVADRQAALEEVESVMAAFPQLFGAAAATEVPLVLADGRIGRIDCLWQTEDSLWIIDYKTEREVPTTTPVRYRNQLAAYAATVRQAYPGREVKAAIIWTATATWAEVDAARAAA